MSDSEKRNRRKLMRSIAAALIKKATVREADIKIIENFKNRTFKINSA